MTIAEKIKNKQPIGKEEFKELVNKTDWEDYTQRVINRVSKIADIHDEAIFKSSKKRYR